MKHSSNWVIGKWLRIVRPSGGILPPAASLALADGLRRPAIIHDGGTSRNDDTFGGNDI